MGTNVLLYNEYMNLIFRVSKLLAQEITEMLFSLFLSGSLRLPFYDGNVISCVIFACTVFGVAFILKPKKNLDRTGYLLKHNKIR